MEGVSDDLQPLVWLRKEIDLCQNLQDSYELLCKKIRTDPLKDVAAYEFVSWLHSQYLSFIRRIMTSMEYENVELSIDILEPALGSYRDRIDFAISRLLPYIPIVSFDGIPEDEPTDPDTLVSSFLY